MSAIIFTHVGYKYYDEKEKPFSQQECNTLIGRVLPAFKSYLSCKNIGLVYVYVDTGIQLTLQHLRSSSGELVYPIEELVFEQTTRNCLKVALDRAISILEADSKSSFDKSKAPKFQFVGLPHLYTLIHSLYRIDPALLDALAGDGINFSYDSPKFVEAVIRIRRGNTYPIFRFDEDVEVDEQAIGSLLNNCRNLDTIGYRLFSGKYKTSPENIDYLNDFAVRLHWLVDRDTHELSNSGKWFLRDLGEIGATQVPTNANDMSNLMSDFVENERDNVSANRSSQQLVSGAGLFMSNQAINQLPPFMNFNHLTLWVDDHLKRRLHEVLGHIAPGGPEQIEDACFTQDRHPGGILDKEIEWARDEYFQRLFDGCILHALITTHNGERGELAEVINNLITINARVPEESFLKKTFKDSAKPTAKAILNIWKSETYGNSLLKGWAEKAARNIDKLINPIIEDAASYVHLVSRWQTYLAAMQRLTKNHAYWLFRPVE